MNKSITPLMRCAFLVAFAAAGFFANAHAADAIEQIARMSGRPGPASLSSLLDQFKQTYTFWKQLEVAEALIRTGDKKVIPALAPWLQLEDRHRRLNAAYILASLGDDRGFDTIRETVNDRSAREEAQGYSGAGQWSVNVQIRADRYYAIRVLAQLKDPRAVPILVPLLADKELDYAAAFALGEIGDHRAIPPLIQALDNKNPDVRIAAISSLQMLAAREAIPRLRELFGDNERCHFDKMTSISEAAHTAVAALDIQANGLRCWPAPAGNLTLRYYPGRPQAESEKPPEPGNYTLFQGDKPVWSWTRWTDQSANDADAVWSANSNQVLILDHPSRADTGLYLVRINPSPNSYKLPLTGIQQEVLRKAADTNTRHLLKTWFGGWKDFGGYFTGTCMVTKDRCHQLLLRVNERSSPPELRLLETRIITP